MCSREGRLEIDNLYVYASVFCGSFFVCVVRVVCFNVVKGGVFYSPILLFFVFLRILFSIWIS